MQNPEANTFDKYKRKLRDLLSTAGVMAPEPVKAPAPVLPKAKEHHSSLTPEWMLGGTAVAGAGGKLHYDLLRQNAAAKSWEASMLLHSKRNSDDALKALSLDEVLDRAQTVTDDYTRAGQRVAQSKLLGMPAGLFPKLKVWHTYLYDSMKAKGDGISAKAIADRKQIRDMSLTHYNMFADSRLRPEEIRGHMTEKAISELDRGVLGRLSDQARSILTTGDASYAARMKAIRKLPASEVDADGIAKLLDTALRGTLNKADGPAQFGEIVRLSGAPGKAMNTGQIYRFATQGVQRKLRGLGTIGALTGGGMLAVSGINALRNRNQTKQAGAWLRDQEDQLPNGARDAASALLIGGAPVSAWSGLRELQRKDLDRIGVTYGEQQYNNAMIGGGHKEPALSLSKIIEDENARRVAKGKKSYDIVRFARNRDGVLGRVVDMNTNKINTAEHLIRNDPGVNTMINTGFGDYIPQSSSKDLRFSAEGALQNHSTNGRIRTRSLINYLTDGVPYGSAAYSATAGDRSRGGRTLFASWGDGAREAHGDMKNMGVKGFFGTAANLTGVNRLRHLLGMSSSHTGVKHMGSSVPFAVSDDKLKMIGSVRSEADALAALEDFTKNPVTDARVDPNMPQQVRDLIEAKRQGKKIVVFSGATRGDYVATRAAELAEELKRAGRNDVHIVAQMAGAMKDPKQMAMLNGLDNVTPLGFMPGKQFLAMQNFADLHGNSTGTSSWVEALLGRGNSFQPKNWGFSMLWPDHKPMFMDDDPGQVGLLGGAKSIAKRTQERLQKLFPGLDDYHGQAGIQHWNLNHLQEQARAGRMIADSPSEVLGLLDSKKLNPNMAGAFEKEIKGAQKLFAKTVFREAARNKMLSKLKGGGKILAPLAMLPLAHRLLAGRKAEESKAPVQLPETNGLRSSLQGYVNNLLR